MVKINYKFIFVFKGCELFESTKSKLSLSVLLLPGFQFFEASAKDNINVKQVFERLVDVICDKMNESMEGDDNLTSNHRNQGLKDSSSESNGSCAC